MGLGHSLSTLNDLTAAVTRAGYGFAVFCHCYWVPRDGNPSRGLSDPTDPSGMQKGYYPVIVSPPTVDNWPARSTDKAAALQPILTDRVLSTTSANPLQLTGTSGGHSYNGALKSINLLFGDGHVELRKQIQMQMRYQGERYNFY
jgi:prepilin-type processing-associated H-X9-DG protein